MQLNVMVVDDEFIHLKSLSNMIARLRPEYEVTMAKNGKEALMKLMTNPVDVLLTDIQMPIMDGLELIEKALEHNPELRVIILSGHREFEYAKKAITYGVDDYLVKPLNKKKVNDMLDEVERSIVDHQQENLHKEAMQSQLNSALPVYFEFQMNKWIRNRLSENDRLKVESIFIEGDPYLIALVKIGNYNIYQKSQSTVTKQQVRYDMKKAFECMGHSVSFEHNELEGLFVNVVHLTNPEELDSCLDLLENKLSNEWMSKFPIFHIATSHVFNSIESGVREPYIDAMKIMDYSFYCMDSVLINNNFMSDGHPGVLDLDDAVIQMQEGMKKCDITKVKRGIYNSYQQIINNECCLPPSQIRQRLLKIHQELLVMVRHRIRDGLYKRYCEDVESCIRNQDYLKVCIQELERAYMNLMDAIWKGKRDEQNLRMMKSLDYIETHYCRDISVEEVADYVYYSSSQFSSCFKKHTGKTFKQYLLVLRMDKACKMLEETNMKVIEISDKTGFCDHKYFHRVFKSSLGVTPDEYRISKLRARDSFDHEVS